MLLKRYNLLILPIFLSIILCLGVSFCTYNTAYFSNNEQINQVDYYSAKLKSTTLKDDGHTLAISASELKGFCTIWQKEVENDCTAEFSFSLKKVSGKVKLIFINSNDEIFCIDELSKSNNNLQKNVTLSLTKGKNRIKIVAQNVKSAELDVHSDEEIFNSQYAIDENKFNSENGWPFSSSDSLTGDFDNYNSILC